MPLKGLSGKRIREHLRKYSPVYIIGIVIMLLLSDILYTSTRPQTPDDQQVLVYLVDTYAHADLLDDLCADALQYGSETDDLLLEVEAQSISYNEEDYTSAMVLMARMSVGDGDAYITNSTALDSMAANGVCLPLDEWVEAGWLEDLGVEPWYYTETDDSTGEETTYVAALKLTGVENLWKDGIVTSDEMYLVIAANGSNVGTTKDVVGYMLKSIAEGTYASAASEEPAA